MTEILKPEASRTESWHGSRPLLQLLGGRWMVPLLGYLSASGGSRYSCLQHALGISNKMLTDTLRKAERDGLIIRRIDCDRMETTTLYELTEVGRSLEEPVTQLMHWTESNWSNIEEARRRWSERCQRDP